jgi:hypothetical protein
MKSTLRCHLLLRHISSSAQSAFATSGHPRQVIPFWTPIDKQRWSATDEAEELLILRGDHATVLCACMAAI